MTRRFVNGDVLIEAVRFPAYLRHRVDAIWYHDQMLIVVDRALSKRQRAEAVIRLVRRQLEGPAAVSIADRPLKSR